MEKDVHVIGIRGEAKQALAGSIVFLVLAIAFGAVGGIIAFFVGKEEPAAMIMPLAIFGAFMLLCIILAIVGFAEVSRNKAMGDKPVLVYDESEDVFIGYDIGRHNAEVRIKNGNIQAISGSAYGSARMLSVRYVGNDGRTHKSKFGYARNIDNGVLRSELNRYHNPKI